MLGISFRGFTSRETSPSQRAAAAPLWCSTTRGDDTAVVARTGPRAPPPLQRHGVAEPAARVPGGRAQAAVQLTSNKTAVKVPAIRRDCDLLQTIGA